MEEEIVSFSMEYQKKMKKSTDDLVKSVGQKLGVEIEDADICRSHRLKTRSGKMPKPIIIKFVRHNKKAEVFSKKSQLKGSNLFIAESLTAKRMELYVKAQEAVGKRSVWTNDGSIFVHFKGKKHMINCEEDITNLVKQPSQKPEKKKAEANTRSPIRPTNSEDSRPSSSSSHVVPLPISPTPSTSGSNSLPSSPLASLMNWKKGNQKNKKKKSISK